MLKKILQDSKESVGESDIRSKMHNLKDQLTNTVNHLHSVCEAHVFIALSRGYWDRMGQVWPLLVFVFGFVVLEKLNSSSVHDRLF